METGELVWGPWSWAIAKFMVQVAHNKAPTNIRMKALEGISTSISPQSFGQIPWLNDPMSALRPR
jgi:hypothetical protein